MKSITSLLITLCAIIGAIAWYHFSDAQVKKRAVQATLSELSEAVASQDRAKISTKISELFTEDALIKLDIHFFAIGRERPDISQNFNKAQFISFIDNILYSLSGYGYLPELQQVNSENGEVEFSSGEWGDGANMMGGVAIDMRYSSSSKCSGKAVFTDEGKAKFTNLSCLVSFRQVPKPGQEGKFLNKNNVIDLLTK